MSKTEWLFSFKGRIGRKHYWTWFAIYYVLMIAVIQISAVLPSEGMRSILVLIAPFILIYPDLAVQARRWHDRGRSNYWLLLNIPVFAGRIFLPTASNVAADSMTSVYQGLSLVSMACSLWILIECGLLKGQPESNRYGAAITPPSTAGVTKATPPPSNGSLDQVSVTIALMKDKLSSIFKQ